MLSLVYVLFNFTFRAFNFTDCLTSYVSGGPACLPARARVRGGCEGRPRIT